MSSVTFILSRHHLLLATYLSPASSPLNTLLGFYCHTLVAAHFTPIQSQSLLVPCSGIGFSFDLVNKSFFHVITCLLPACLGQLKIYKLFT